MYARGDKCGAIVGRSHWMIIWNYLCLCWLLLLSDLMSELMPDFNSHYADAIITLISSFSTPPKNHAVPYIYFLTIINPIKWQRLKRSQ